MMVVVVMIIMMMIIFLLLLQMHIPADNDFQTAVVVKKQRRGTCASFSVSASTFAYKIVSVV